MGGNKVIGSGLRPLLIDARKRLRFKVSDIAEAMGVSVSQMYRLESGDNSVSEEHLRSWVAALGLDEILVLGALCRDSIEDRLALSESAWRRMVEVGKRKPSIPTQRWVGRPRVAA